MITQLIHGIETVKINRVVTQTTQDGITYQSIKIELVGEKTIDLHIFGDHIEVIHEVE